MRGRLIKGESDRSSNIEIVAYTFRISIGRTAADTLAPLHYRALCLPEALILPDQNGRINRKCAFAVAAKCTVDADGKVIVNRREIVHEHAERISNDEGRQTSQSACPHPHSVSFFVWLMSSVSTTPLNHVGTTFSR
jgi:hypothetical protein